MENYIKKLAKNSLITSVFLAVLGFFMVLKSYETVSVLIIMFGWILVLDGLIHLASYFKIDHEYRYFSYELAQAIIDILLGFVVTINVKSIATILPVIIGVWIVLDAILKLQIALNLRDTKNAHWCIMTFCSLITIFIGFGIIFDPARSLDILMKLCGSALVFSQIFSIFDDIIILGGIENEKTKTVRAKSTEK